MRRAGDGKSPADQTEDAAATANVIVPSLIDPQEHNKNGMELRAGDGNSPADGAAEGDRFNTVWILDTGALPFHLAEKYHQFHDGIGKPFPPEYKVR